MKLVDVLDNILDSCKLGSYESNGEFKQDGSYETIIEGVREPQTIFKLRLNDTSYSDNILNSLSNNEVTSLYLKYVDIGGVLSDVLVTFKSTNPNIVATVKVVSKVEIIDDVVTLA